MVLVGCEPDPPIQYTITYHVLDGASNPSSNPSSYTVESATIQLSDPSRTGYTFAGWYSSANYTGEAITHIPQGSSGPKHLYAQWTANTYTVSFNSNDQAIPNPDPQDLIFGQAYASLPTLTKAYYGHTWNTAQDGNGTTITNATTLSTAQNHTLYAQWTPTQYTITYELNNGQNHASNPATYTFETSTITLADPSRSGYTFGGWYTEAAFTTQITTIAQGSHDNLTLHAKWTANTYTVSFDSNDQTIQNPTALDITFGQTYASLPILSKPGYSHTWNTAQNGSGTTITNATTLSIADHHTLYAQWTANTYTVTLDKQSGSGGSSTITATYAAAMPNATAPTRTGYTFGGYYASTNGGGNQYYTQAMASTQNWNLTTNTTLYAKWEPVTYTITYHLNSGTAPSPDNPTTYTIETNTITLKNPTRTYYSFLGWYAQSTFETVQTTIPQGSTGNKDFYAKWSADSYTITYELYGGTNNSQNPASYTYESNTITLAAPSKTGYTFAGWFAESTYNTQITSIASQSHENKTLHAKWTATTYTVTLSKQNGSGGSDSVTATYDAAMPTATIPTRTGYTFGGYYTAINGGGTQYYTQAMASSRAWDLASHTTLYAKWNPITYTLTYHLDGGTAPSPNNPADYTVETSTINLTNPTRTGYTFAGWYDNSGMTGTAVAQIPRGSSGNKDLYAKWTPFTYNLTYHLNSGTAPSPNNPATYTIETSIINLADPAKDYYEFSGWYAESSFGTQVSTINEGSYGNKDLSAKWTPINYPITYDLKQDMINHADNPSSYTVESATITLKDPTRQGYYFGGWYAEPTLTTLVLTIPAGSHCSITLYPKWNQLYNIGDSGPKGGKIFLDRNDDTWNYLTHLGDYNYRDADAWRYMEAANSDLAVLFPADIVKSWDNGHMFELSDPVKDRIGYGKANTDEVCTFYDGKTNHACYAARDLNHGLDGWFLPSLNELEAMLQVFLANPEGNNFVARRMYWSSTDATHDQACSMQYDYDPIEGSLRVELILLTEQNKWEARYVSPVRRF